MTEDSIPNMQPKTRDSNLELFRIISMLLIVAHHFVVNSGLLPILIENAGSTKSLVMLLFGWAGKTGINCFVLITGYFMCKSEITLRKGLKLFFEVEFYKIVIFAIFCIGGYIEITPKLFIKSIFPIPSISNGFVSCYLVFFCFIPFLNILIRGLTQKSHLILISLCFVFFSVLPNLTIKIQFSYVSWFMVIYVIAAYIRLHPIPFMQSKKITGICLTASLLLSWFSVWFGIQLYNMTGKNVFYFFVSDSNKPLALLTAVFAFLFFKNLKIGYSKIINTIAASCFGVLLIHVNSDAMRQWLWKDTLDNVGHYDGNIYLYAILSVLGVYIVCTAIDFIRIQLIEKPIFKFFDRSSKKF